MNSSVYVLLVAYVLCSANSLAQPPAAGGATTTTDVTVSTEDALLAALGTPTVLIIRMASDIAVQADSVVLGASPSSGVYRLTRNVTITAPHSLDWYPALDVSAIV